MESISLKRDKGDSGRQSCAEMTSHTKQFILARRLSVYFNTNVVGTLTGTLAGK